MKKFKLLWENNPDTPISAKSLSNSVDSTFEYKDVVYKDIAPLLEEGNYSDEYIKLRANTKVLLKSYTTSTMLFNKRNSLTSHNSKYGPITQDNVVFLDYVDKTTMAYAGIGTTNIISNSGFESDLTDWTFVAGPADGSQYDPNYGEEFKAKVELSTQSYEGNKCVRMYTGEFGRVELSRIFDLTGIQTFSLSFFYRADGDGLRFSLSSGGRFWKNDDWNPSASDVYSLTSTNGEWKRVELKNIPTQTILATISSVEFIIYSQSPELTVFVDAFQLEANTFCSPYTSSTRSDALLQYPKQIVSLDRGYIDVVFYPKEVNDFSIVSLETTEPNNAFELNYVKEFDQFEFKIYDTTQQSFVSISAIAQLSQNIDSKVRVACGWDKDYGLKIKVSSGAIQENNTPFSPIEDRYVSLLSIASSRGVNTANIIIDSLKFNGEMKENIDMTKDFSSSVITEDDVSKVLYIGPEAITLGPKMLDVDSNFSASTDYFIYAVDDMNDDTGSIVLSKSNIKPEISSDYHTFSLVGGFRTDVNSIPFHSSVWDKKTKQDRVHTKRFLANGFDSDNYGFDIRTQPLAEENDVRSTYPIHFSNNLYGRTTGDSVIRPSYGTHQVQYFEVNKDGWMGLDNLYFDGNKIQTRNYADHQGNYNNDLDITVHNAGENPRVWIHAPFVDIDSGTNPGQDIHLDDILIDNNKLYTKVATDLLIDVTERDSNNDIVITGFNIIVNANNDLDFNINSDFTIATAGGVITLDDVVVNGDNIYSNTGTLNIDSSSTGQIELDDIHIKDNNIHRDAGDIDISSDNININASNIVSIGISGVGSEPETSTVIVRSDNFVVESKFVEFRNVDLADFITFDKLRIQQSTLSSPEQTMYINSDYNIELATASNIEFANTGGIFVSRVNSYFVNDTFINNNLIFSKSTNVDAVSMYASANSAEGQFVLEHNSGNASIVVSSNGITINGDLTVTGTQSTVNSTDTEIADATLTINVSTPAVNQDAAFEVQRTTNNARLFWSDSDLLWKVDNGDGILHNVIFNGYDERFEENVNIVTTQPAGFKLENDLAVGGMELLNPDSYTMAAGEAIMNVGLHMNQSGGYIGNKLGSEALSVGGWMRIDTRSSEKNISFIWEESNSQTEIHMGGFYLTGQSSYQLSSPFSSDAYFQSDYIKTSVIESESAVSNIEIVAGDSLSATFQADGNVTFTGEVYAAKVHNAVWGDIAETWVRDGNVEYGQVVYRTVYGVKASEKRAQKGCVGVVSNSYGYLLKSDGFNANKDLNSQDLVPIALKGTVVAKVEGDVSINDEVVSYKNGKVIKASWFEKVFKRDRIVGVVDGWNKEGGCVLRV